MHDIALKWNWNFSDLERIGDPGGFGEVFEGRPGAGNPHTERVAIKRLFNVGVDLPRECRIARQLIGKDNPPRNLRSTSLLRRRCRPSQRPRLHLLHQPL